MFRVVAEDPSPFSNVSDQADKMFTVAGIICYQPTNNARYTIGDLNSIRWRAAGAGSQCRLYYISGTSTNEIDPAIIKTHNTQTFPTDRTYFWDVSTDLRPSENARIMVRSSRDATHTYRALSQLFVLRGILFTAPTEGRLLDLGGSTLIQWEFAGFDAGAAGSLYLSSDGGRSFETNALNTALIPVDRGRFTWDISKFATPTTNAVIKFKIESGTATDLDFEALSKPFALRGLKVVSPAENEVWSHGQSVSVDWIAALAGNFGSLYYSPDGPTGYDLLDPIVPNQSIRYGTNNTPWDIEFDRIPSTNAYIRAVSSTKQADSKRFSLEGIKVIRPRGTYIWALNEDNTIEWAAAGVWESTTFASCATASPTRRSSTAPWT